MSPPRPRPILPPPKRQRSLSASSASPAPLSPAFRLSEQYLSITDEMDAFSLDRDTRTRAVQRASSQADKIGVELRGLRQAVAAQPNDLSLRLNLLELAQTYKRALENETRAKQALNSPSIAGPSSPRLKSIHAPPTTFQTPLFPPSPPRTPSPTPLQNPRPLSASFRRPPSPLSFSLSRPPSPTHSSSTATTAHPPSPRLSFTRVPSSPSRSSSPRFSPIPLPLPPATPAPRSDPLPALALPSVLITSHLVVPGFLISHELGLVQASAPSSTDLGGLKERLRLEGEKRGAHAVLGVKTRAWEGGELVGVGRAVKLRRV
ncbi:hypothetical protein JCM8547_003451 [Rhodosporidiobolus lusitaniae]